MGSWGSVAFTLQGPRFGSAAFVLAFWGYRVARYTLLICLEGFVRLAFSGYQVCEMDKCSLGRAGLKEGGVGEKHRRYSCTGALLFRQKFSSPAARRDTLAFAWDA